MKLGLINSAWLGTQMGTAEGIHLTKEIGFDTIIVDWVREAYTGADAIMSRLQLRG